MIMRFERSHLILIAGFVTVAVTVCSNLFRTVLHTVHNPFYTDIPVIVALLQSVPALLVGLVGYGLIFGLPFASSFFMVKQKYLYAGIGSVVIGLFWFTPIINNAISYAPLSWIGRLGVGIVLLCNLSIGVIALLVHYQQFQLSTIKSNMLGGMQLICALIVPITLVTYWITTPMFGYL
jgi:hypothetical protein